VPELWTLGDYEAFMRILFIVIFAVLIVGSESSLRSAPITAAQAETLAVRLANDKADKLFHHRPFQDDQPAHLVAGHWVWVGRQGYGRGDFQTTVELAANGSTNNVDLQCLDSQDISFGTTGTP